MSYADCAIYEKNIIGGMNFDNIEMRIKCISRNQYNISYPYH